MKKKMITIEKIETAGYWICGWDKNCTTILEIAEWEFQRKEAEIDLVVSVYYSKPLLVMTRPKCGYRLQSLKSSQVEMRQRKWKGRLSVVQRWKLNLPMITIEFGWEIKT